MDGLDKIKSQLDLWESRHGLKNAGARPEVRTGSGAIAIKPLYSPVDLENTDYLEKIGFPGNSPFTRGIDPEMYRNNPWSIGEYAGFGTAEDSNRRFKYLIEKGQTGGINIALDLPTQLGYDSGNPVSRGEVGRVGVALDSLADIEILFDGIPLDKAKRVFTTANAISPIMLAWIMALAEKQGVDFSKFVISVQNDILKEFVARGTYIYPPEPSIKITTDVIQFCSNNHPLWRSITVCGSHMRQAGANAVQEIAFALSNLIAYVERTIAAGVDIDRLAPTINLQHVAHNDLFEEIAKFRAIRYLWTKIMKNRFHAQNEDSLKARLLVFTAGSTLTAQQPLNNIARVTVQALAAILGGAQVIYTASYDEALATPTEEAVTVAIRTQQILASESNAGCTADPLGGSYFIETLTRQMAGEAEKLMAEIELRGGAVKAIEEGYYQKLISEGAFRFQRQVENGERVVVGVNQYQEEEDREVEIFEIDPEVEQRQIDRLKELKRTRDNREVVQKLKDLESKARGKANLIPTMLEVVKTYATIEEICDVLRGVYGTYEPGITKI